MAKPNFTLPNKPAIKSGSILSYNYTDDFTFVPTPLTFNRDSAATRVNEKGLIEDVGYFGPELVQNGNFEQIGSELITNGGFDTDTGWTKLNATISDGKGNLDGDGQTSLLYQNILTQNKLYKVTFTVSDYNETGEASIINANGYSYYTITENGTFTVYFKHINSNDSIYFRARLGAVYSIDNVSVKEVGQNWLFQNGWNMGDGVAVYSGTVSAYRTIYQQNVLTVSSKYRLTFDIISIASGSIENISQSSPTSYNTVGTKTEDFIATNTDLFLKPTNDADLTIDNISVIEVLGDKPRIDYSDSLTEPSLLLEPQRTNLVTHSEDFSQSSWTKNNTSVLENNTISPSGTLNASKLFANVGTGAKSFYQLLSVTTSQPYVFSVFLKKSEYKNVMLRVGGQNGSPYVIYDLDTQSVVSESEFSSTKIESYNNDWYRVSAIITTTSGTTYAPNIFFLPDNNYTIGSQNIPEFNGDGISGGFIWGAQVEQGSYATSYIPTAGSSATRLGETANNAGDVNVFNSEEGVLYAEIAALANGSTYKQFTLNAGSPNDSIRLMYTDVDNQVRYFVRRLASTQADITYTLTDATQFNKIAMVYKANDFQLWVNGIKVGTDTSGTPPSGLNTIDFNDGGISSFFYGNVKNLKVFNKALTDRELEILTIQ